MKVKLQMYYIPVVRQSSTASPVKVNNLSFPLSGNFSKCTGTNTCALCTVLLSLKHCLPFQQNQHYLTEYLFQENVPSTSNNTCALGSYLGMVDLWYDCNVCSLGQMIPDLARTVCQKMGRFLAYLPYMGKKYEHTCIFCRFSHSVWNEEV